MSVQGSIRTLWAVGFTSFLVTGCGSAPDSGTADVEREMIGDTMVVRNLGQGAWGAPRTAEIDLSIGTLDGPEETMFGAASALATDGAGGVYVYDRQVPAIRHFDAEGVFLGQIGREGEGPGEYLDAVLGMAVRKDGRLQIRDARNGRVTLYEPDGSFSAQWTVASGLFTSRAMFVDVADHTYLKALTEPPEAGENWKIGLLHYDEAGTLLDTIPDPWIGDDLPVASGALTPSKQWTLGPDGSMIVGFNRTYAFEVRRPDGSVTRVTRNVEPLSVGRAEHAAYEERREYQIEQQGRFMTALPEETPGVKPAYRSLYADDQGRVWVRLFRPVVPKEVVEERREDGPPVWPFGEPHSYDVFEGDGTYLGRVDLPDAVSVHVFGLDRMWGIRRGELGENYVVRMRLGGGG